MGRARGEAGSPANFGSVRLLKSSPYIELSVRALMRLKSNN